MKILKQFIAFICLLLAAGFLKTGDVEAHAGGKMQIASQDTGPFKLTVWTSPNPAQVGKVHVAVAVASAETALPILDADVFVELIPKDGQAGSLSSRALRADSANQFLFESIFDVPADGVYTVSIQVTGVEGGQGDAAFDLEVEPATPLIFGLAALVGLGLVTGGAVYFYLRSTQTQPEA